jgi:hypothetical protein
MNLERIAKRIILTLLFLAFLPEIARLLIYLVREVVSRPSPLPAHMHAPQDSGFGAGVLITLIGLLLVVGLLTRIGRALRNPEAAQYRTALDRRARTLPRFSAEADEVPIHGTGPSPTDDDPELPWE